MAACLHRNDRSVEPKLCNVPKLPTKALGRRRHAAPAGRLGDQGDEAPDEGGIRTASSNYISSLSLELFLPPSPPPNPADLVLVLL